jgi:hypothetical protein
MIQASMSRTLFSFKQKLFCSSRASNNKHGLIDLVGWDGIAVILNILLLSVNLRQHFRFREPLDHYPPVQAQAITLLSQEEAGRLDGDASTSLQTLSASTPLLKVPTTPPATKETIVAPPHSATTIHTTTSPVMLPPVKIPQSIVQQENESTPSPNLTSRPDASHTCTLFGPLTFNRLQQLNRQWKQEGYASPLNATTTQPIQLYSVIYPPLSSVSAETKGLELNKAGFKHHETWVEGHSASVIVLGNFQEAHLANQLLQRLHQKGFREAHLMVRSSPTIYWLKQSQAVQSWIDHPSIAKAEGVSWKTVPCPRESASSTLQ